MLMWRGCDVMITPHQCLWWVVLFCQYSMRRLRPIILQLILVIKSPWSEFHSTQLAVLCALFVIHFITRCFIYKYLTIYENYWIITHIKSNIYPTTLRQQLRTFYTNKAVYGSYVIYIQITCIKSLMHFIPKLLHMNKKNRYTVNLRQQLITFHTNTGEQVRHNIVRSQEV